MPLIEHIRELRTRLLKSFLGLLAGTIVGFVFFNPIWDFLQRPYCQLPAAHKLTNERDSCDLVVHSIFDGFFLHLKISLIVGVIISSPVWLYQIWSFVTPGLYRNERRWAGTFVGVAVPLFLGGAALAYLTLDKGLRILLSFVPDEVIPVIGVSEYLGYLVMMLLVFGVSLELPLFVVLLNFVGVLSHERLKRWRRTIIFLAFVFAAVATPSQDPFTMLALAVPMVILFEVAELVAGVHDRRKARLAAATPYSQLSDDETSPLDLDDSYDLEQDHR